MIIVGCKNMAVARWKDILAAAFLYVGVPA
jgi:hypothetical protein